MASRERSAIERRRRAVLVWGAVVLCATAVSCSRGRRTAKAKAKAAEASTSGTLIEGTGLGTLRIDEATVASVADAFGAPITDARTVGSRGEVQLSARPFTAFFMPPANGQGPPRLYALRAVAFYEDKPYTGRTSKGVGLLDSIDAMTGAYGPPDAEWIGQTEHIEYYQQGVIFATAYAKGITPALFTKAQAALGKPPGEAPDGSVVTCIAVVRRFTVSKAAERLTSGQQVLSAPPQTDLLDNPC